MKKYTIIVDPAYMFDFISIYEVKLKKKESEQARKNYEETMFHICGQIGFDKYVEIKYSPEYEKLYTVNSLLFDLVDEIKRNPNMNAHVVDDQVWERYLAKKALQEKFFPEENQKEQKFDYKKK